MALLAQEASSQTGGSLSALVRLLRDGEKRKTWLKQRMQVLAAGAQQPDSCSALSAAVEALWVVCDGSAAAILVRPFKQVPVGSSVAHASSSGGGVGPSGTTPSGSNGAAVRASRAAVKFIFEPPPAATGSSGDHLQQQYLVPIQCSSLEARDRLESIFLSLSGHAGSGQEEPEEEQQQQQHVEDTDDGQQPPRHLAHLQRVRIELEQQELEQRQVGAAVQAVWAAAAIDPAERYCYEEEEGGEGGEEGDRASQQARGTFGVRRRRFSSSNSLATSYSAQQPGGGGCSGVFRSSSARSDSCSTLGSGCGKEPGGGAADGGHNNNHHSNNQSNNHHHRRNNNSQSGLLLHPPTSLERLRDLLGSRKGEICTLRSESVLGGVDACADWSAALPDGADPRDYRATSSVLEVPGGDSEHVFCMMVHRREGGPFMDLTDFLADMVALLASHRLRGKQKEAEDQLQKEAGRRQASAP